MTYITFILLEHDVERPAKCTYQLVLCPLDLKSTCEFSSFGLSTGGYPKNKTLNYVCDKYDSFVKYKVFDNILKILQLIAANLLILPFAMLQLALKLLEIQQRPLTPGYQLTYIIKNHSITCIYISALQKSHPQCYIMVHPQCYKMVHRP